MFREVLVSKRILNENKSLIGKFVRVGMFDGKWVTVKDSWSNVYKVLPPELSEELCEDAYGSKSEGYRVYG